jgi:hypothetical protein
LAAGLTDVPHPLRRVGARHATRRWAWIASSAIVCLVEQTLASGCTAGTNPKSGRAWLGYVGNVCCVVLCCCGIDRRSCRDGSEPPGSAHANLEDGCRCDPGLSEWERDHRRGWSAERGPSGPCPSARWRYR